jgi:hypothetical protein
MRDPSGGARGLADRSITLLPVFLLVLLAALLLGPALWGDQAPLPGAQLRGMAPWAGAAGVDPAQAPWNPLVWDAAAQFYPWRLFAARWIAQGVLPLWDPHQFCGTPFLANSQSALLYPPNWLIYLPLGLTVTRGMAIVAWLHLALAGTFTFLWLRALGASRPAAFTAGVAYMLSGFAVTWLELPTLLSVACWLPLLFLAVHRLIHRPDVRMALAAGVVVALILLGGHLQIAFYCLLGAGLYGLVEWGRIGFRTRLTPPIHRHLAGRALFALALGACLAAPQLLPAMELSRISHRVGSPTAEGFAAYVAYAMPVGNLITLFLPDFFGNPARGDFWGAGNYAEYAGYIGVVSLFLAFAALLHPRRCPQTLFLGLLALFALAMATGSPLNALFYFGVPGFGQSGSPGRILVLFCFATACLAGLGLDVLLATDRSAPVPGTALLPPLAALLLWGLAFWGATAAAAAFLVRGPVPFSLAWSRCEPALTSALALVGISATILVVARLLAVRRVPALESASWLPRLLVPAIVALDLWSFAAGYNPMAPSRWIYPQTEVTRLLAARQQEFPGARIMPVNRDWNLTRHPGAVLPPNAALALGLEDIQGYDSLFMGRYKGLANAASGGDSSPVENGNMVFFREPGSPLLPLLGVRTIISARPLHNEASLATTEGVYLYDRPDALPRALLIEQAMSASTEEGELEALQRLADGGPAALRHTLIVPAETGEDREPSKVGVRSPLSEPKWRRIGPNAYDVRVRADRLAWLLVTESWNPGWRAWITRDGRVERPVPVTRGHFGFLAVRVEAGEGTVRLAYEPESFRRGLFLAGLGWMALAAGAGARWSAKRRRGSWLPPEVGPTVHKSIPSHEVGPSNL